MSESVKRTTAEPKFDKPFEEKLKELGVPREHSIFEIAYGDSGYNLMTVDETVAYAAKGKDMRWFYNELKRRYNECRAG